MKITVVGGVFWDTIFYGSSPHFKAVIEMPGGTGLNVAVGLAALGNEVKLIGCVGVQDFYANKIETFLRRSGVEAFLIRANGLTGRFISANEKNVLAVFRGVNTAPFVFDVLDLIDDEPIFVSCEIGKDNLDVLRNRVEGFRSPIFVDPLPPSDYIPINGAYVMASESEATVIDDVTVVKLGAKGAVWNELFVASTGEENPFPLGAGDAFDAVFIDSILKGYDRLSALKRSVTAGELVSKTSGSSIAVIKILGSEGEY